MFMKNTIRRLQIVLALGWASQALAATEMTGDSICVPSMCVKATCNGTDVEFVLESTGPNVGWMAIGFGSQMANTPMIIMWPNSDGPITLSPREATSNAMPEYDISPRRIAYLSESSDALASRPKLAFKTTIHAFNQPQFHLNQRQTFIYAMSQEHPGSASLMAPIAKHDAHGILVLDLSKPISGTTSGTGTLGADRSVPYSKYEKLVLTHAIMCAVGFLVLLPIGALVARFARTFTGWWFTAHWVLQLAIAGPVIIIGFAIGVQAVNESKGRHLKNVHERVGVALVSFYVIQCILGALIHFIKPVARRPPQNYVHAVFGVGMIAFSFWQVRTGYHDRWTQLGRGEVPKAVNIAWTAWIAIVPTLYIGGLALLRRQFRQEKAARVRQTSWAMNEYK